MPDRRYRLLLVCSHPVQYASPLFRRMAKHPRLEIQVAYCSMQGVDAGLDPEFGVPVKWDVPLLEGYPWVLIPNKSPRPGLGRFWGLFNVGLWGLVSGGGFDAVLVYTGYVYVSFWITLVAAKIYRRPILFGTDAVALTSRDGRQWKPKLKRWVWPRLFGLANMVIVPSTRTVELMRSVGIPDERLALTPFVVDNDWWINQAKSVDRAKVRQAWGVPEKSTVVLFCAKLQPWKRPLDVMRAFAQAKVDGSHLVFAGEGPLRAELESHAVSLGVLGRVHFLGFTNQSQLPEVYRASDLLVLASDYEPFGLVVNEAMLCECPVIVSDQVGAGGDLVLTGQNGFTYTCGDVDALASLLREVLSDRERLRSMGTASRGRMATWSPRETVDALVRAVEQAVGWYGHKTFGPDAD